MFDIDQDEEITELIRAAKFYRDAEKGDLPHFGAEEYMDIMRNNLDAAIEKVVERYGIEVLSLVR